MKSTKSKTATLSGEGLFSRVDDAEVVISSKGEFRQVDLYQRGRTLYAEVKKEVFVRLVQDGSTSSPPVKWDEVIGREVKSDGGLIVLK